jgi:uncharacterized protein (AIM24 family)
MNIVTPARLGHVHISLEEADKLHLLHPKSVIAFQGSPQHREDRLMNLSRIYHKRKMIQSQFQGPSELAVGLPAGCSLEVVEIDEKSSLLFDLRHVMFFTDGIQMKSIVQKLKNAWITKELIRMRFTGPGLLGIITAGDMMTLQLQPEKPLFVEAGALVAYPGTAAIRLSVYGNQLASQHMNVQWELRGSGPVLIQTGSRDAELEARLQDDGLVKRILRELLPFGSVYIK